MPNDNYAMILDMALAKNKWERDNQQKYEKRQNKLDKLSRQSKIWSMLPGLLGTLGQIGGMAGLGAPPAPDTTGLPDLAMPDAPPPQSDYTLRNLQPPSPFSVSGGSAPTNSYSLMRRRR